MADFDFLNTYCSWQLKNLRVVLHKGIYTLTGNYVIIYFRSTANRVNAAAADNVNRKKFLSVTIWACSFKMYVHAATGGIYIQPKKTELASPSISDLPQMA